MVDYMGFELIEMAEEQKVSEETIKRVEDSFLVILKRQGIKYKSKKYYEYQVVYFSGAIMALNVSVAKWGVALMSNREIIDKY